LLNIQHDAGRGAASGCGLVALVRKALKARHLQPLNIHVRPTAGHSTATGCCLYYRLGMYWAGNFRDYSDRLASLAMAGTKTCAHDLIG